MRRDSVSMTSSARSSGTRDLHVLLVEEIEAQEPDIDGEVRRISQRTLVEILQLEALSGLRADR